MSEPAAGPRLSDRQRLSWLRLIRTPNVGPASFRDLINRFGSAEAALAMLPELMISGGAKKIVRIPSIAEAEAELEAARRAGARFVGIGEADYPPLMKSMDHPPPLLAVRGSSAVFRLPAVAIVGARNASLAGIKMARRLAADLGRDGYGIV
ncbi:DNA-processing protein DprA, partial [Mesorhizobium sp. M0220]